jgi:hypothetical protein
MPASISPAVPEIGIECNEFAFLPGLCEVKDGETFTFLQGASVPSSFEKPESVLLSGATTPGEESSEVDDQSDYEFQADGQEEYYDFLREMGCEFQQAPDYEEDENEYEDENELEDEVEDEVDVEFSADGQEDYYDFLREMGCPFEKRVVDDEETEEEEEEEEVEDWDGSEEWFEDCSSKGTCVTHTAVVEKNQTPACDLDLLHEAGIESQESQLPYDTDFCVGPKRPFRSPVSITPGPSLCLQQALTNVAAQRHRELTLPSAPASATMERSWEIINCKDFDQSC